jgi:hypothetical protein
MAKPKNLLKKIWETICVKLKKIVYMTEQNSKLYHQ